MKAVRISAYGGVEVLEVVRDVPKPAAAGGQILVEVYAAGLNPFDRALREGYAKEYIKLEFPAIMGVDFAGVVVGTGEGVYGQGAVFARGTGAFAEFVAADVGRIAPKPKNVDFIQAACLPLVGMSAIQAIETHIKLQKGQRILIHGGAGGIGSLAIQLAKVAGAYVATTVSGEDKNFVQKLGADEVIDYKTQAFEELLFGFDAVYDTVGGETTDKSFKVLKKGGIIVSMLGAPNSELAKRYGVAAIGQNTEGSRERLSRLSSLVEKGWIEPQVDKVFILDEVREAFTYLEKGSPRGKVVLKVK